MTYNGGSKQELHMGLRFFPVCHCHPVCSHFLHHSKYISFYFRTFNTLHYHILELIGEERYLESSNNLLMFVKLTA